MFDLAAYVWSSSICLVSLLRFFLLLLIRNYVQKSMKRNMCKIESQRSHTFLTVMTHIRIFSLNSGTSLRISKQLNIPGKDLFNRNENIIKDIFQIFLEKHYILTLKKHQWKIWNCLQMAYQFLEKTETLAYIVILVVMCYELIELYGLRV